MQLNQCLPLHTTWYANHAVVHVFAWVAPAIAIKFCISWSSRPFFELTSLCFVISHSHIYAFVTHGVNYDFV